MSTKMQHFATFASLFLVLIIDVMGFGLVFPLLGPIFLDNTQGILSPQTSLFWRDACYGVAIGVFEICMFLGAPIGGDLSDQIGRKKVLLIYLFGTAIGYGIAAIGVTVKSIILFLLGRILSGFMAGSQPIAQAAIADISTTETKARNLSLITMAAGIGFVAGPMIGGYFSHSDTIHWFNFTTPFVIAGLLALINTGSMLFTFKETFVAKQKQKLRLLRGFYIFFAAFRHEKIRLLAAILLLMQLGWSLYFQYISLYLTMAYHFNSNHLGKFMAYLGILFVLSLTVIIRLFLKFFDLANIVIISILLMIAGLLGVLLSVSEIHQWLYVIPIVVGASLAYTGIITLCSNLTDTESQGWIMGVTSAIISFAWAVTGITSGLLGYLHIKIPFVTSILLLLACLVLLKTYSRTATA